MAAEEGKKRWIRVVTDLDSNEYSAIPAKSTHEPDWLGKGPTEFIQLAFQNKMIVSEDHPIIKRLLGVYGIGDDDTYEQGREIAE